MDRPITRHIDFLDPIRGIAILLVFAYHALGAAYGRDQLPWGRFISDFTVPRTFVPLLPVTFGWAGVPIFFVVSGFCIHLSFSRQPQWFAFFKRRFFRIYPAYLVVMLFFALIYPLTRLGFTSAEDAMQLISHLALFYNVDGRWVFGINPSFWSIAVEVQLYALYPLLLALIRRFGWRRSIMGVAAIELSLRLTYDILHTFHGTALPRWVCDSPFFFWFSWSMGAVVAELYLRGRTMLLPRGAIPAIAACAIGCRFVKPLFSLSFPLFSLLTAAIVVRLLHDPKSQLPIPAFMRDHLARVGLWSFSLYLIHQPLLMGIPRVLEMLTSGSYIHPFLMFTICLASWLLIVPIARLLYQFVEVPGIAFGKRVLSAKG